MEKVIVYRSQVEAQMDQVLMSGEFAGVFGYILIFLMVVYGLATLLEKYRYKRRRTENNPVIKFVYNHVTAFVFGISIPVTYVVGKIVAKLILL